jgi:hypothetical protein
MDKPKVKINIHGPQAIVYRVANAMKLSGAKPEVVNRFGDECENAGFGNKRKLLEIARKYAVIEFSNVELTAPKKKPAIKVKSSDGVKEIMDKTRIALSDAGAGPGFVNSVFLETVFCNNSDQFQQVAQNYVTLK